MEGLSILAEWLCIYVKFNSFYRDNSYVNRIRKNVIIYINVKFIFCCSEKAKWCCFANKQFGFGCENAALGKKK